MGQSDVPAGLGKELTSRFSVGGKALPRLYTALGGEARAREWDFQGTARWDWDLLVLSQGASEQLYLGLPPSSSCSLAWRGIASKVVGTGKAPTHPFFESIPHHYADGKAEAQRGRRLPHGHSGSSLGPMFVGLTTFYCVGA